MKSEKAYAFLGGTPWLQGELIAPGLSHHGGWTGTQPTTMSYATSTAATAYERGCLHGVKCGSFRTFSNLFRAGLAASPVCPFCGLEDEDLVHIWWRCPRWHSYRDDLSLPSESYRRDSPACTQNLGIFMESEDLVAFHMEIPAGGELPQAATGNQETVHEGRVVVWTDGACRNNQDNRLRRAGVGVFYSQGHRGNRSIALPGRCQTNNRAELLAVLTALKSEPRSMEIRTDSEYVYKIAAAWQDWALGGWWGDHADMWCELGAHLMSRHTEIMFTKVLGHAKERDIHMGRSTVEDKAGNDGADGLATAAAAHHAAPRELVLQAAVRKEMARATDKMMLQIIAARRDLEPQLVDVPSDVDPDPG